MRTDEFESKKRSVGGVGQCYNVTIPGSVELKGKQMNTLVKNAQSASATEKDPRWASVVARNAEADGTFYYSVKTTGVYCRPSCAARLARPEHVRFHATCTDAERAGFRPCKRCRPNQPARSEQHAARVTEACRFIEEAEDAPSLEELAEDAGISPAHFHRMFKAIAG